MARKKEVSAEKVEVNVSAPVAVAPKTVKTTKTSTRKTTAKKTEAKPVVSRKKPLDFDNAVALVKKSIKSAAVKKISDKIAVEVTVTGSAEGVFYIEIENNSYVVEPYNYVDKDVVVLVDTETLELVKSKELKFSELFAKGKVQVFGDVAKAVKVLGIF